MSVTESAIPPGQAGSEQTPRVGSGQRRSYNIDGKPPVGDVVIKGAKDFVPVADSWSRLVFR